MALSWEELRYRLDENRAFNAMRGTPYYGDAVYERFSAGEVARRYAALRDKLRARNLDCAIVPGGPSHWSFGGGMLWLTGHWEWHGVACYVVVPLEGEPALVYGMGGTHTEAVRRETAGAIADVRHSRGGRFGEVMAERMVDSIGPDRSLEDARTAGQFFREHGAQSRPIHLHGIDLVTASPHVFTDRVESDDSDDVLQPGMVLVVEPTPITADGSLGMFFGHTFLVTDTGRECLDQFPWQLTVVPA